MDIKITTPRLWLREINENDKISMFEMDSDPEVHQHLGRNPVKNIDEISMVIQMLQKQYKENGIARWAVIEKSSNHFVGWAGLKRVDKKTPINKKSEHYDLGYRFMKNHWGKGYATEAAAACLKYGFEQLKQKEIFAYTDLNNLQSRKVLEKIGLRYIENFFEDDEEQCWYKINSDEYNRIISG